MEKATKCNKICYNKHQINLDMNSYSFNSSKTYFIKLGLKPGTLEIFLAETAESVNSELADSLNFTYVLLIPHNIFMYIRNKESTETYLIWLLIAVMIKLTPWLKTNQPLDSGIG